MRSALHARAARDGLFVGAALGLAMATAAEAEAEAEVEAIPR
jgi:hypothetical protein